MYCGRNGTSVQTITNQGGCDSIVTTIVTYVGSEDVVINETTCDAGSAGTTTVTLTNANDCEYWKLLS
ncbi:MAG: hypothetical protein R2753_11895 [Chitinophagales bacterium]